VKKAQEKRMAREMGAYGGDDTSQPIFFPYKRRRPRSWQKVFYRKELQV
jgi:hypothetical protein